LGTYALQRVPLPSGPVRHSGVEVALQCMHVRPVITRGTCFLDDELFLRFCAREEKSVS
jgi:hypothetical protein